jgi:hypothetical protein
MAYDEVIESFALYVKEAVDSGMACFPLCVLLFLTLEQMKMRLFSLLPW